MNLATALIGPLFAPECRRSARKGWLPWVRALAAALVAVPCLAALWWWWINAQVNPDYRVGGAVFSTLALVEALVLILALVLGPAVLAGSLAGEKERGSIGLLLSTRVDAREIVLGRMLGKLSLVASILLAASPFLIGFAVLGDFSATAMLALIALPASVGFGAGGVAVAASSVARRGRNALLVIYLAQVLLLLAPLLGLVPGLGGLSRMLGPLNPFGAIAPMVQGASAWAALPTIATWTFFGVAGVAFASWRLRPSYLALVGGKKRGLSRRYRVPEVDEARPMMWKELHIERVGALGWFGRILGALTIAYLAGGSLLLSGLALWWMRVTPDPEQVDFVVSRMGDLYGDAGSLFACLIELAIGLRAAVAVSSERERGTWDALLTSPLSGREILGGKLWGSVYSLRWLIAATLMSWTLSLVFGAIGPRDYAILIGQAVVISLFSAAVGVRASLANATATKAMTVTVGIWLGSLFATVIFAALVMMVAMFLCLLSWLVAGSVGLVAPGGRPWVPVHLFGPGVAVMMALAYLGMTLIVVAESRGRFDHLAGRAKDNGADPATKAPPASDPLDLPAPSTGRPDRLAETTAMVGSGASGSRETRTP